MYIVSSSPKKNGYPVRKRKTRRFLKKPIFHWGTAKDCKELADSMYVPLFLHLVEEFHNPNKKKNKKIDLTFSKIKKILGKPLPRKAKTSSAWWKNKKTSVQAKAWRLAGWKTLFPNVSSKKITFVRGRPLLGPLELLAYRDLLLNRYQGKIIIRLDACMPV